MPVPAGGTTPRVYATDQEYADWLGVATAPDGAASALRRASMTIDQMLLTSHYQVDDDGLPTDAAVAEALRDATCAQAEYARGTGDSLGVGASQFHSISIGSIQLGRGYGSAGSSAPGAYSPVAWQILQRAGLTGLGPSDIW